MNRQTEGWTDKQKIETYRLMQAWKYKQKTDKVMNRLTEGWTDKQKIETHTQANAGMKAQTEGRQTKGQTDWQEDGYTNRRLRYTDKCRHESTDRRQTDKGMYRRIGGWTDKQKIKTHRLLQTWKHKQKKDRQRDGQMDSGMDRQAEDWDTQANADMKAQTEDRQTKGWTDGRGMDRQTEDTQTWKHRHKAARKKLPIMHSHKEVRCLASLHYLTYYVDQSSLYL